jgi:hypothetical protein
VTPESLPIADLALVGTTSAGKSTLANAIACRWVLAFSVQETTRGIVDLHLTVQKGGGTRKTRNEAEQESPLRGKTGEVHIREIVRPRRGLVQRLGVGGFVSVIRRPEFLLRDTPGIVTGMDRSRLDGVVAAVSRSRVSVVLLSAEETDRKKKEALVRAALKGVADSGGDLLWVISRADAFLRDGPEALKNHRRDLAALVADAGGSVDVDGKIFIAVSPRPAFLATVLSFGAKADDAVDLWRWVRDDISLHKLNARYGRRDPSTWSLSRRVFAIRALWKASGVAALDRAVDRHLSTRWPSARWQRLSTSAGSAEPGISGALP